MQPYEYHFGFREPPFSLTPDPRFFYAAPVYREAYATLRYGIEARKGFVLINGDAGTGKTTLLRMLMQEMDSSFQAAFICNPPGTFTELLRIIMNELALPELSNDRVAVTAQFNDYLLEQLRKNRIVSVLVDEAQRLSQTMLEDLRLLSNFETHTSKLIQMVLIGQPELEMKLEKPELRQLKQRIALRCSLKPLRRDDIAPYIDFRLAVAGYRGRDLFDAGSVAKIALYTRGVPRLINVLCDNALLRACERKTGYVSEEVIDEAARDLWLVEPRQSTVHVSDSGVSPSDVSPADDALANAPIRMDFGQRIASLIRRLPHFRKPMSTAVRAIWPWIVVIGILAVAADNFYTAHNEELLTPAAGDMESPVGSTADKAVVQKESRPAIAQADSSSDIGAAVRRSSLDAQKSFKTGDLKRNPGQLWKGGDPLNRPVQRLSQEAANRSHANTNRDQWLGTYNVVGSSFVREKPTADAEITGALEPGTKVQVVSKTGEYFRVRALDPPRLSGYVHVEDAFFERSK